MLTFCNVIALEQAFSKLVYHSICSKFTKKSTAGRSKLQQFKIVINKVKLAICNKEWIHSNHVENWIKTFASNAHIKYLLHITLLYSLITQIIHQGNFSHALTAFSHMVYSVCKRIFTWLIFMAYFKNSWLILACF